MFDFNTTLTYGLRLLINLANSSDKPKQLRKIAQEEAISLQYLRKLIIPLEEAGIVKSRRGPGGGFMLKRIPSQINLLAVTNALNRSKVIDCVKGSSACQRFRQCLVKDFLEEVYNKVKTVFRNKTLATVIRRGRK